MLWLIYCSFTFVFCIDKVKWILIRWAIDFLNVWLVLCLTQSHRPKDSGCLSSKGCRFTIIKLRTVEARRFASRMHFIVWKMSSVKVKKSSEQNRRNIINTFWKGSQQCWLWAVFWGEVIAYWGFDNKKDLNMLIERFWLPHFFKKCFVHYMLLNSLFPTINICCYCFCFLLKKYHGENIHHRSQPFFLYILNYAKRCLLNFKISV